MYFHLALFISIYGSSVSFIHKMEIELTLEQSKG